MGARIVTAVMPDLSGPALEPESARRAHVREWRRELAEWLRGHGVAANGPAWDAAVTGERDLATLRRVAVESGTLARHWSGVVPASAVVVGDAIAGGVVVATITDPEDGSFWATVQRVVGASDYDVAHVAGDLADVRLAGYVPVVRGRGLREVPS